jgi:hypothetical protein
MQQQFVATVSGAQNTGVLWQAGGISGGNGVVGTITANGTYTAPSAPPTGGSVVVTAISIADNSKSGSAVISVVAQPQPVSVSIVPTSASVQAGQTQQFIASVTGTVNTSVIWSVNGKQGGDPSVGTILPDGLYTASDTVRANASVTVTAKSSYDSNTFASATVLIAASTMPPPNPTPTTYYLDATGGDDSNNGTSPETAWKSLDQIYLLTVVYHQIFAGSQILLKAGETWDGQIIVSALGTASLPIILGKYGTGANPILYGDMHTAAWTEVPGHPGIYQAAAGRGTTLYKAYEGTTELTVENEDSLDFDNPTDVETYLNGLAAGSWGPRYMYGVTQTLVYVKTLDGSAPTNVKVFRDEVIHVSTSSYFTIQDLDIRQTGYGIMADTSDHMTVQRVSVQDTLQVGIALSSNVNNTAIQDCTTDRTGNDGIYSIGISLANPNTNLSILRNTVSNVQHTVLGLQTYGDGDCIGVQWQVNTLIEDNSCQHIRASCFSNDEETNDITRRNYCYAANSTSGLHGTGNAFYDNVIDVGDGTPSDVMSAVDIGGGNPTVLYNNVIYGGSSPGGSVFNPGGSGQVIFRNNILYSTGTRLLWWGNSNGASVSDNNLFYFSGTPVFHYSSTDYNSLAAYSAATGQDTHSIFADPKFTDPATSNFTLQASSPAINAGANLGDTYKLGLDPRSSFPWATLDQTAYGSGWEIGAFSFMPGW